MRLVLALAMGAAVLASAAAAQTVPMASRLLSERTLVVAAGERVTLRVSDDGRLTLLAVVHADPADAGAPAAPAVPGGPNPMIRTPAGTLALTLDSRPQGTTLKVENAMDRSVDYQAAMLDGVQPPMRAVPTSVCTVLPHIASLENWEKRRLPAVLLGGFTLSDTKQVSCPQPQRPPGQRPATGAAPTPTN